MIASYVRLRRRHPANNARSLDTNDDMDGLAGIADGTGEIGVQIGIAEKFVSPVDRRDGGIALDFAKAVGTFKQFGRLDLFEECWQLTVSHSRRSDCHREADGR